MTADEITKEEAAKFIKKMRVGDSGGIAHKTLTANILQTAFEYIEDIDLSNIELSKGEADEILSEPLTYEWLNDEE